MHSRCSTRFLYTPNARKMSTSHDRRKQPECPERRKHPCYLCTAHLPVNDSLVLGQAKDSGPGVSFLRLWGNTAYLNKTKAHLVKSIHSLPMLVKPCSDSHRISELSAQDSHFLETGRQSQRHRGCTSASQGAVPMPLRQSST